ncbi:MAG: hypothetical protein HYS86_04100 [Candidatus Chisholmbacteria bacterium]|nr:hypothetical protein [Candidatus Chisholmbacteria bacterium]
MNTRYQRPISLLLTFSMVLQSVYPMLELGIGAVVARPIAVQAVGKEEVREVQRSTRGTRSTESTEEGTEGALRLSGGPQTSRSAQGDKLALKSLASLSSERETGSNGKTKEGRVILASHPCGSSCNQFTQQGACTHGCWAGGNPNPDYRDTNDPQYRNTDSKKDKVKSKDEPKQSTPKPAPAPIPQGGGGGTGDGGAKCDGWADSGSSQRNAGNGCTYSCQGGAWSGPKSCDGKGTGEFQGDNSSLSADDMARSVEQLQREAEQFIAQNGVGSGGPASADAAARQGGGGTGVAAGGSASTGGSGGDCFGAWNCGGNQYCAGSGSYPNNPGKCVTGANKDRSGDEIARDFIAAGGDPRQVISREDNFGGALGGVSEELKAEIVGSGRKDQPAASRIEGEWEIHLVEQPDGTFKEVRFRIGFLEERASQDLKNCPGNLYCNYCGGFCADARGGGCQQQGVKNCGTVVTEAYEIEYGVDQTRTIQVGEVVPGVIDPVCRNQDGSVCNNNQYGSYCNEEGKCEVAVTCGVLGASREIENAPGKCWIGADPEDTERLVTMLAWTGQTRLSEVERSLITEVIKPQAKLNQKLEEYYQTDEELAPGCRSAPSLSGFGDIVDSCEAIVRQKLSQLAGEISALMTSLGFDPLDPAKLRADRETKLAEYELVATQMQERFEATVEIIADSSDAELTGLCTQAKRQGGSIARGGVTFRFTGVNCPNAEAVIDAMLVDYDEKSVELVKESWVDQELIDQGIAAYNAYMQAAARSCVGSFGPGSVEALACENNQRRLLAAVPSELTFTGADGKQQTLNLRAEAETALEEQRQQRLDWTRLAQAYVNEDIATLRQGCVANRAATPLDRRVCSYGTAEELLTLAVPQEWQVFAIEEKTRVEVAEAAARENIQAHWWDQYQEVVLNASAENCGQEVW